VKDQIHIIVHISSSGRDSFTSNLRKLKHCHQRRLFMAIGH